MRFTEKCKRFWSLRAQNNSGFTLVELIVVIAILAILAGVAVPAYSGYVEKANKQADMTLVSEVEQALVLAAYDGTFDVNKAGYITLSTEGIKSTITEDMDVALKATFGEGYQDILKLKYAGWSNKGFSISAEEAEAVYLSNYMQGNRKEVLLDDVEKMTSMAQKLVTSLNSSSHLGEGQTLSTLFGSDTLNETAAKYGIGDESWTAEKWDEWGGKEENKTAYSNLLVLTAAAEAEKRKNDPSYEMSTASEMILEFSSYYGFAAQNSEFAEEFDEHMERLNDVQTVGEGGIWYRDLQGAIQKYDDYNTYQNGEQGEIDRVAFQAIMAGLGNPTKEQASNITADLNNENLFTSGVVNGMYNDYLTTIDMMVIPALGGEAMLEQPRCEKGQIAIQYVLVNGEIKVWDTRPTEKEK